MQNNYDTSTNSIEIQVTASIEGLLKCAVKLNKAQIKILPDLSSCDFYEFDIDHYTKDIQNIVSYIVTHRVPVVFVETSIAHRSIQALQRATQARGWNVSIGPELYSDALGNDSSPASTYIAMMKYHCDTLVHTLKK